MASRRPIRTKEIQNPDRILSNLLKDYVDGNLDDYTFLYRASVVKIDQVGGVLETDPPNPKNSIQARVITNARDSDLADDELPVFYPLFTHDVMPLKEGEHVYIIFEDANEKTHGLWLCRIADPNETENANLVVGTQKYQDNPDNDLSQVGADQAVQDTDVAPTAVQQSEEFVAEEVPKFVARIGDRVIEGSNNTIIVLSRDRPTDPASGETATAGTIDIVAGRAGPDNMNMADDKSRIYITMNSDVDGNMGINVGEAGGPGAYIAVKSDHVRIVARNGMKLVVEGGNVQIDGAEILLGAAAEEAAVLGNKLVAELGKLIDALAQPPLAALGSVPLPPHPSFVAKVNQIKATLEQNILSQKNKVE